MSIIAISLVNGKVTIDIGSGASGYIVTRDLNVLYRDNYEYIFLSTNPKSGNDVNSIKLKITDIQGRPSDNPKDVAEWLRDNFFFKLTGLGESTPKVNTFNDLPDPNLFSNNTIYFVESSTGYVVIGGYSIPVSPNSKKFGFYYVDGISPSKSWIKIKGGFTAQEVYYNNSSSGLTAQTSQAAIDELDSRVDSEELINISQNIDINNNTTSNLGTIGIHSDVDLTGIVNNRILRWIGSSFVSSLETITSVFGRTGNIVASIGDYNANQVNYDNSTTGIISTEVQGAIDELIKSYWQGTPSSNQLGINVNDTIIEFVENINSNSSIFSVVGFNVTILKSGNFKFSAQVSSDSESGNREGSIVRIQRNSGAGFLEIPLNEGGASSYSYHRNIASGEGTANIDMMLNVSVGDSFRVVINSPSNGLINTIAIGTNFIVEEK